jgi:GT2 family glycosyltransferase
MTFPKVCIIILNWNGKELLKDCLSSLFKLTDYPNYKVIVVDNGSTDGSVRFVIKNFPKADVLCLDRNYGFSRGNNEGIRYAFKKYTPHYFLLLNNDTEVIQTEWLTNMVKVAKKDDRIGIVGCKMVFPDGKIQCVDGNLYPLKKIGYLEEDRNQYDYIKETTAVSGSCILVSYKLVKKIGVYDEVYSPFGGEDQDWFFRTLRAGFKIIYCGKSKIVHKESVSLKKVHSNERFYINTKNSLILAFRYYRTYDKIIEFFKSLMRIFIMTYYTQDMKKKKSFNKDFLVRLIIFFKAAKNALTNYKYKYNRL